MCQLETKNDLAQDGYEHIVVQREIGRPDLDLLREIENIRPGGFPGDCALVFLFLTTSSF
jgi:hypothetical protein